MLEAYRCFLPSHRLENLTPTCCDPLTPSNDPHAHMI